MRLFLVLLFLIYLTFSTYQTPPIQEVMQANELNAPSLTENYVETNAKHGELGVVFISGSGEYHDNLLINSNLEIAGPSILIDNSTVPQDGLSVILVMGEDSEHLPVAPGADERSSLDLRDSNCDYQTYLELAAQGLAWICDFDNDDCAEYENHSEVAYSVDVTLIFRNISKTIEAESNVISIPSDMLYEMHNSSGLENLSIILNGTARFSYTFNDRQFGVTSCTDSFYTSIATLYFNDHKNFTVQGQNTLFFLKAPILREQWHTNNRFDVVVLSQNKLYDAKILLNNSPVCNYPISLFEISDGPLGLQEISSLPAESNLTFIYNLSGTEPIPLSNQNNSYGFVYEFDCHYAGLGKNNLSIITQGLYGTESYKETINSRMLSYSGSIDETGSEMNKSITRPSIETSQGSLFLFEVSIGMLGLLVILMLINRSFIKN